MLRRSRFHTFRDFFRSGSSGGVLLFACVIISLLIANSSIGESFNNLLQYQTGIHTDRIHLRYSVLTWINDGLMAVFFLMVGLEIKRSLVAGELSSVKKAVFPVFAAFGGVLAPAVIYAAINHNAPTAHGWGIPMATDIAFALAVINLLGKKVPVSLKIFLAALAIIDDLMAILVIALFYSSDLHLTYLLYAAGFFILQLFFNRVGVRSIFMYIVPGMLMWYFIHHSGIHATIAGVLTAMTLPLTTRGGANPLERLEHLLVKPVNLLIIPLFALANTNIRFEAGMAEGISTPVGMGVILGLCIGKPLGITLFSWLSVKSGLCRLPEGAGWMHIVGVGILGGIGFTMSIFIALLSFSDPSWLPIAKFSVLTASLISGICGYLVLRSIHNK